MAEVLKRKMARTGGNILGTRHRVKGIGPDMEPRPTKVTVLGKDGQTLDAVDLHTEDDELDFIRGIFPVKHKKIEGSDDPNAYPVRHVKWKKVKESEDIDKVPEHHTMKLGKEVFIATHVPVLFDGLMPGDTVVGVLGGSGDRWNAACFRQGQKIGARVYRATPFVLSQNREIEDKDEDGYNIARLFIKHPELFYEVEVWDRQLIEVREKLDLRRRAMKNRIAIEQQIRQALIGMVYTSEDDLYPEGTIEDACNKEVANDKILAAAIEEEKRREKNLTRAVEKLELWSRIFEPMVGSGPMQASKIIAGIGDIRRFRVEPDHAKIQALRAYRAELETKANFSEGYEKIKDTIGPDVNHYDVLNMIRDWKLANSKAQDAKLLNEAITTLVEVRKLTMRAYSRGMAKFRAYCGVHLRTIDKNGNPIHPRLQFPRKRRRSEVSTGLANWNNAIRQALYLLVEQANRRPESFWGKKLLENKKRFRAKHPEPEMIPSADPKTGKDKINAKTGEVVLVECYTIGHIHKMAWWATAQQIANHIFNEWNKIEDEREVRRSTKIIEVKDGDAPRQNDSGDSDASQSKMSA